MTHRMMTACRRGALLSAAGMLLASGLAGCLTSQGELDRQAPRTLGRPEVRAQIHSALDTGRQWRQAGKDAQARELYKATARRLADALGPRSDAGNVLTHAMTVVRAGADGQKATTILEAALVDAAAAEDFDIVVSGRLAEGFPEPSPVGAIRVKRYPAARTAETACDGDRDKAFTVLFAHLQAHGMEMTCPALQTHSPGPDGRDLGSPTRIAFYYERPTMGSPGTEGQVVVADVPPAMVVSVGVRGGYTSDRFAPAVGAMREWLADHADQYVATGAPRVLVYNSTVVPAFMRYAEVQIPVRTK